MHFVPLLGSIGWPVSADALVRMSIFAAVLPGASPAGVVDNHRMAAPVKAVIAPAPWPEESSERHAKAETNRASNIDTRTRSQEDDSRVVVRDDDVPGVCRHDRGVRTASDNNLAVAPKIPVIKGFSPLSLDRAHYILLLRKKSVAQVGGPVHVRGHHLQHGWERQQRLNTGIPRKLIP